MVYTSSLEMIETQTETRQILTFRWISLYSTRMY
jgi:hypothetical protein